MGVKPDTLFGDPEFHQRKVEIRERLSGILTSIQKTVETNGYAVQAVQRFRVCLHDGGAYDVTTLPVYSETGFSRSFNKIECVLCKISRAVQLYWNFCGGNEAVLLPLDNYLTGLEEIITKGLGVFKVAKSLSPFGYYLEESV